MVIETPSRSEITDAPEAVVPPPGPIPSETVEYAGWGRRFLAWLIDWFLLFGSCLLVGLLILGIIAAFGGLGDGGGIGMAVGVLVGIAWLPFVFAYFVVLNGRGQTLGKRALGVRVADAETLQPIGTGQGALRELVRYLSAMFFYIPFFIDGLRPLWNDRHQSWHDSAARSIVIRDR
jgi:uncharacterized RDD family membrane protein YckC